MGGWTSSQPVNRQASQSKPRLGPCCPCPQWNHGLGNLQRGPPAHALEPSSLAPVRVPGCWRHCRAAPSNRPLGAGQPERQLGLGARFRAPQYLRWALGTQAAPTVRPCLGMRPARPTPASRPQSAGPSSTSSAQPGLLSSAKMLVIEGGQA